MPRTPSRFPKLPFSQSKIQRGLAALVTGLLLGQAQAGALAPAEAHKKGADFLDHWAKLRAGAMVGRDYWTGEPDYFEQLRVLGSALDEEGVKSLSADAPHDAAVEILLVAREAASTPASLELLRGWYGMPRNHVTKAFLKANLPEGRESTKLIALAPEKPVESTLHWTTAAVPFGLRPEHTKATFRLAWEALLLAPPTHEREFMDKHIFKALQAIKDPRSVPLLREYFRQYVEVADPDYWDQASSKMAVENVLQTLGAIHAPETVDAFLKCLSLAEAQNRADRQPRDITRYSIRESILKQLGGDTFRGHRRFEALMKDRLAAAQKDPALHGLDLAQRGLLEEALRRAALSRSEKPR